MLSPCATRGPCTGQHVTLRDCPSRSERTLPVKKIALFVSGFLAMLSCAAVAVAADCHPASFAQKAPCSRVVAPEPTIVSPVSPGTTCWARPVPPEPISRFHIIPEYRCNARPVPADSLLPRPVYPETTCYVRPVCPRNEPQRPVFPDNSCVTVVQLGKGNPSHCPTLPDRNR
jgi:hypothetical protein